MYAVMETGGKQFRVEPGMNLKVDKLAGAAGDAVAFDRVLVLAKDGAEPKVGAPTVPGASVKATIVRQAKDKKILVFKYKPKKRIRKKTGHRTHFTLLKIDAIEG